MNSENLTEFAKRYAKAWCSQNPESVAAFFADNASFTVNGGPPTPPLQIARGFMRDFPDMIVTFDKLEPRGDRTAFQGAASSPGFRTHAMLCKPILRLDRVSSGIARSWADRSTV